MTVSSIYSHISPADMTDLARLMVAAEDQASNQTSLTPWFPSLETNSIKWEGKTGTTRTYTQAAPYRAWDTPAAIGTRPGRGWASGKLAPISMKFTLGEQDQIMIREMAEAGAAFADVIAGDILDDLGNGVRAILNRNELAMSELFVDGTLTLEERGLSLQYDSERAANRRPAALTGSARWTEYATASPFAVERASLKVLKAYGLGWNDLYVITNQDTFDHYGQITEVIETYNSNRVLPRLDETQIVEIRAQHRLPEVIVNDSIKVPYGGVERKLIPDGMWIYVPKTPVGRSQWAPTVAATSGKLQLAQGSMPGVVSYVRDKDDPITLETVIDAITIPTFFDPDATMCVQVY